MVIEQVIGSRLEICLTIFPLSCHRTIGYPWKYVSTVEVGILGKEYFLTEAKALSVILRTSLFSSTRKLIFQERRTFLLRISQVLGDWYIKKALLNQVRGSTISTILSTQLSPHHRVSMEVCQKLSENISTQLSPHHRVSMEIYQYS